MSNRRKHPNSLPVSSFVPGVVIAFFLMIAGLSYVYYKNQLCSTGDHIKALEREFTELQTRNEVMRAKISSLSSTSALQNQLAHGIIKLIPIADNRIVRINGASARNTTGEIRPVANEGVVR